MEKMTGCAGTRTGTGSGKGRTLTVLAALVMILGGAGKGGAWEIPEQCQNIGGYANVGACFGLWSSIDFKGYDGYNPLDHLPGSSDPEEWMVPLIKEENKDPRAAGKADAKKAVEDNLWKLIKEWEKNNYISLKSEITTLEGLGILVKDWVDEGCPDQDTEKEVDEIDERCGEEESSWTEPNETRWEVYNEKYGGYGKYYYQVGLSADKTNILGEPLQKTMIYVEPVHYKGIVKFFKSDDDAQEGNVRTISSKDNTVTYQIITSGSFEEDERNAIILSCEKDKKCEEVEGITGTFTPSEGKKPGSLTLKIGKDKELSDPDATDPWTWFVKLDKDEKEPLEFRLYVKDDKVTIKIETEPKDATLAEGNIGNTNKLFVEAKITPEDKKLTYQWYETRNISITGNPIDKATEATFTIPSTLNSNGSPYYYYVEIKVKDDESNKKYSRTSTVTVLPTLKFNKPTGGKLSAITEDGKPVESGKTGIPKNTDVKFTAEEDVGYKVVAWKVDGEIVSGQTSNKYIHNMKNTATISVELAQGEGPYKLTFTKPEGATDLYAIQTTGTGSGTMVASGSTEIPRNADVKFTVAHSDDYRVIGWKVGGVFVTGETGDMYTHTALATTTIEVVLESTYKLTFTKPANASKLEAKLKDGTEVSSVTATTPGTPVNKNEIVVFTVEPSSGYRVVAWKVDGEIAYGQTKNTYEHTTTASAEISVDLGQVSADNKYTLKFDVPNNASSLTAVNITDMTKIESEKTKIADGDKVTFTVNPAQDYRVKEWKVGAAVVAGQTGNTYTHTVVADAAISVELEEIPSKLPLVGAVAISGAAKVGATLTAVTSGITSAAPLGVLTYVWKVGGTEKGANASTYTPGADDKGKTVTVTVSAANYSGSLTSNPTAEITTDPILVTVITIDGGTSVGMGRTLNLTLKYTPDGAEDITEYTNKKWTSSNPAIATVTEAGGVVNGVAEGSVTITAKSWKSGAEEENALIATVTITVTKPKYTVTFTPDGKVSATSSTPADNSGDGGKLPNSAENVTSGSTVTFTAEPSAGYRVVWKINGNAPNGTTEIVSGAKNITLRIENITAAKTVSATFEAMPDLDISISPASKRLDFGEKRIKYGSTTLPYEDMSDVTEQVVTITNTGSSGIVLSQPTSSKNTSTDFAIGDLSTTALSTGQTATFTVRPKAGLTAKQQPYSEEIKITGIGSNSIWFDERVTAEFTVLTPPAYGISATPEQWKFKEASKPYSYTRPEPKAIIIKNTGSETVNVTTEVTGNTEAFLVSGISKDGVLAVDDQVSFVIWPNENLPASGEDGYKVTVKITAKGVTAEDVTVTKETEVNAVFVVKSVDCCTVRWSWITGGSAAADNVEKNAKVTVPTKDDAPPRGADWTFVGWYSDELKTREVTAKTVTITRDTAFYAKWTSKAGVYTVYFYPNYPNGGTSSSFRNIKTDDKSRLTELPDPTPTLRGYKFSAWYTLKEGGEKVNLGRTFADDAIVYARWDLMTYNITYDLKGGTVTGNPASYTVETPSPIIIKDPARPGYLFTGWTDEEGDDWGPGGPSGTRLLPNTAKSKKFTANWEESDYTITLNRAGGKWAEDADGDDEIKTVLGGWLIPKSLPTDKQILRPGYEFKGWYTAWEGGAKIVEGTSATKPGNGTIFSGDATIYARWEIKTFTIKADPNGGKLEDGVTNPTSYTAETGGFMLNNPVMPGFEFLGWADMNKAVKDRDTVLYVYFEYGDTKAGNRSFKAIWGDAVKYVVLFDANADGEVKNPDPRETGAGGRLTSTLPTLERENYIFIGWFTERENGRQLSASSLFTKDSVTVYAQWDPSYTITLNPNGGAVSPATTTTGVGRKLTYIPTAYRDGYTMEGWYTSTTGGTRVTSQYEFSGDMTIHARWIVASAGALTFNSGANGVLSATVDGAAVFSGSNVAGGKTVIFKASPIDGYGVVRWTVNGVVLMDTSRTYTLYGFSGPTDVRVTFDAIYVSLATPDRVIPGGNANAETSIAVPTVLTAEFAAGPNPVARSSGEVNFFYRGSNVKSATLLAYNESGKLVRRIAGPSSASSVNGRRIVGIWDLKDAKGRAVSDGTYLVKGVIKTAGGKSERVSAVVGVRSQL